MTTKLKLNQISPAPPAKDDVVDLSSAQNITGDKIFQHTIKINADSGYNTGFALININSERNQRMISGYTGDMETIIGSVYWNKNFTTGNNRVGLRATKDDGGSYADLYVSINFDGTPITYAPTPVTSDNSTKIATTAFVKSAMSTWNAVTLTPVTTYCTNVAGNYAACYQNPYLKLCTVGFNLCLAATTIPSSTAIVTGFPKALHHFGCALCNGTINIRAYISTTGALMLDGAQTLSSTVWVDGSVTYPYSSL